MIRSICMYLFHCKEFSRSELNKSFEVFFTRLYTNICSLFKQLKTKSYKSIQNKEIYQSIQTFESLKPYLEHNADASISV